MPTITLVSCFTLFYRLFKLNGKSPQILPLMSSLISKKLTISKFMLLKYSVFFEFAIGKNLAEGGYFSRPLAEALS